MSVPQIFLVPSDFISYSYVYVSRKLKSKVAQGYLVLCSKFGFGYIWTPLWG